MLKHLFVTTLFASLCIPGIVSAQEDVSTSTEITTASSSEEVLILCKQSAIEKRDTEILSAKNIYNKMMEKNLLARKDAEKKVVAILEKDIKKTTLNNAVEMYRNSVKIAQETLTSARQKAWETFTIDLKTCTSTIEETISQAVPETKTVLTPEKNNDVVLIKKETKEASTTKETVESESALTPPQEDVKTFGDIVIEKINGFKKMFGF